MRCGLAIGILGGLVASVGPSAASSLVKTQAGSMVVASLGFMTQVNSATMPRHAPLAEISRNKSGRTPVTLHRTQQLAQVKLPGGGNGGPPPAPPAPAHKVGPPPTPNNGGPPPIPNQAGPPPIPQNQTAYFVVIDGQKEGPWTIDQVKKAIVQRKVTDGTLMWKKGLAQWTRAKNLPEIAELLPHASQQASFDCEDYFAGTWDMKSQTNSQAGIVYQEMMIELDPRGQFRGKIANDVRGRIITVPLLGRWESDALDKVGDQQRCSLMMTFERSRVYIPDSHAVFAIVDQNTAVDVSTGDTAHRVQ